MVRKMEMVRKIERGTEMERGGDGDSWENGMYKRMKECIAALIYCNIGVVQIGEFDS